MDIRWNDVFTLRGRIGRRTFWLLSAPFFVVLAIMTGMSLNQAPDLLEVWDTLYFYGFGFTIVFSFFGVRRLHDRGISGKWMWMVLAPFILAWLPPFFPLLYLYPLLMLILLVIVGFVPGHGDRNEFGLPGSGSPFPRERPAPGAEQAADG